MVLPFVKNLFNIPYYKDFRISKVPFQQVVLYMVSVCVLRYCWVITRVYCVFYAK